MIVQFLIDLLVDRYDRSFVFWHSERGKDFHGKILDGYVERIRFQVSKENSGWNATNTFASHRVGNLGATRPQLDQNSASYIEVVSTGIL